MTDQPLANPPARPASDPTPAGARPPQPRGFLFVGILQVAVGLFVAHGAVVMPRNRPLHIVAALMSLTIGTWFLWLYRFGPPRRRRR
jgi:hypothetical protein